MHIVKKGLAVGHQVLEIADLGPIDRWIVDFVEHAARGGEPDGACSGIGGADDIFGAVSPARLDTGGAPGARSFLDDGHQVIFLSTDAPAGRSKRGGGARRPLGSHALSTET